MTTPPFLGKKILIITAHPDDESYCAAGTLYANYKADGENSLICASLGERGRSHMKRPITRQEMKKIRRKELLRACSVLHVCFVRVLGLSNEKLAKSGKTVFKKGLAIARHLKPDAIVSFGSDGFSGHYDHISVGKAARQIASRMHLPFYSFTLPQQVSRGANQWLVARHRYGHYRTAIFFSKPMFCQQVSSSIKYKALRCHKSQMDNGQNAFTGFPSFAVKEMLKAEYFSL